MTIAIHTQHDVGSRHKVADVEALTQLHTELLRRVSTAHSKQELLVALAGLLPRYVSPVAMFYFGCNSQGQLLDTVRLLPAEDDGESNRYARHLSSACVAACRQGRLEVRRLDVPAHLIVASPIVLQGHDPEAVGFIFVADQPAEHFIMLVQLLASHLVLWHVLAAGRESEHDACSSAALLGLLDAVGTAPDLRSACFGLVAELQTQLKCRTVAVGLRSAGRGHCRLHAISGVAHFDLQSPAAVAIEAAMDEAVLRNDTTVWPGNDETRSPGALAHKNVCPLQDVTAVVSAPLHDCNGVSIGAILVLADSMENVTHSQRFLQASERSIARSLEIATRLEGGRLVRFGRTVGRIWQARKTRIALAAIVAVAASMAIPFPYRLHCDCQIEPATRRFIAAPFEGTLEKSLVKPGDVVQEGDLLARMDGREIRWKRASVEADQNQAIKKRDSAQAVHNYAEMQINALEVERLSLELRLLDFRAEHMELRSPVTGVIITGDLERSEGAPLAIGQTLFEIAPLEHMVVEVAVSDADVSFIREGQPISVRLDAHPRDTWETKVTKVNPRSEIRDATNVFIAEADLDNPNGQLSPGMKGRANVETVCRPIGWILFHEPWEYMTKKLNW